MIDNLKQLIENSERILVTSHISPDPDAVSSLLLMGTTLKASYPEKDVSLVLEEQLEDLNFLAGYGDIEFGPMPELLANHKPQLFILVDANNYERCSRHNGEKVRHYLIENAIKTVIIDHHELAGKDDTNIFINRHYPAAVEDVYETCFVDLGLTKPEGYAQTAMMGLYADTGGFVYMKDDQHSEVFKFADELVTGGANLEFIKNSLYHYTSADMSVISELTANTSHGEDFNYSFLSDEFVDKWLQEGNNQSDLQRANGVYLDDFVRNIDDRQWGFIVYKNTLNGERMYSVSLRAAGSVKDVSTIASYLGGGGHKPAAGAKIEARDITEAIDKVKQAIKAV